MRFIDYSILQVTLYYPQVPISPDGRNARTPKKTINQNGSTQVAPKDHEIYASKMASITAA